MDSTTAEILQRRQQRYRIWLGGTAIIYLLILGILHFPLHHDTQTGANPQSPSRTPETQNTPKGSTEDEIRKERRQQLEIFKNAKPRTSPHFHS